MAPRCSVCLHAKRGDIDRVLALRGMSFRAAASKWKLNKDQLYQHYSEHLPDALRATLVKSQEAKQAATAIDIAEQLLRVNQVANHIMAKSVRVGEDTTALQAAETVRKQLELHGKLYGALTDATTVNVLVMPEWLTVQAAILDALAGYPEARLAVAHRLALLSGGPRGVR